MKLRGREGDGGEVDRLEEMVKCLDGQLTEVVAELKETVDNLILALERQEDDRGK